MGHLSFPNATSGRNPPGGYSTVQSVHTFNPNPTVLDSFSAVFLAIQYQTTTKLFPITTPKLASPTECPNKLVKNSINLGILNRRKNSINLVVANETIKGVFIPPQLRISEKGVINITNKVD